MKQFIERVGCLLQLLLVALGFIIAGYFLDQGWIIGVGALIILFSFKGIATEYRYHQALQEWLEANTGSNILFYPTKKVRQGLIEASVIPVLRGPYLKVYYQGPKIVGDIPPSIVVQLINTQGLSPNKPALAKIAEGKVDREEILEDIQAFGKGEISQAYFVTQILKKEEKLNTRG